ncbi:GNAT family N-acetyltransferase [Paenibacillus sp. CMM36]
MYELQTNRLLLKTLDLNLIEAAARRDIGAIEALGYKTSDEWPGPDKNNGTRGFDSWIIVDKDNQEIVGGIDFLGDPDQNGMIEIGFATNESHRRKGYCYEVAQKIIEWSLNHEEVQIITARCVPDNISSKNLLLKLGFQICHKDEELLYWKYQMKKVGGV